MRVRSQVYASTRGLIYFGITTNNYRNNALFLMMLVVGIAFTTSIVSLIYFALPIFLAAILGIKFDEDIKHKANKTLILIHKKIGIQKAA